MPAAVNVRFDWAAVPVLTDDGLRPTAYRAAGRALHAGGDFGPRRRFHCTVPVRLWPGPKVRSLKPKARRVYSRLMRFRLVALAVLVLAGPPRLLAQALPHLAIESFPDVSRRAIGGAYDDAVAHPNDAARVGRLAMLLHAWEQFDTAALVYGRVRHLERRFDWYYLAGQVETRLAHHEAAAQLLTEAVRLEPDSVPARLALADALFEHGRQRWRRA